MILVSWIETFIFRKGVVIHDIVDHQHPCPSIMTPLKMDKTRNLINIEFELMISTHNFWHISNFRSILWPPQETLYLLYSPTQMNFHSEKSRLLFSKICRLIQIKLILSTHSILLVICSVSRCLRTGGDSTRDVQRSSSAIQEKEWTTREIPYKKG